MWAPERNSLTIQTTIASPPVPSPPLNIVKAIHSFCPAARWKLPVLQHTRGTFIVTMKGFLFVPGLIRRGAVDFGSGIRSKLRRLLVYLYGTWENDTHKTFKRVKLAKAPEVISLIWFLLTNLKMHKVNSVSIKLWTDLRLRFERWWDLDTYKICKFSKSGKSPTLIVVNKLFPKFL